MNKEEKIERIVDSSEINRSNMLKRIKSLSKEEKIQEYISICAFADEKSKKLGIKENVRPFKEAMSQIYDIHVSPERFNIGMNLFVATTFLGLAGYFVGYQIIIKPIIEYFSK